MGSRVSRGARLLIILLLLVTGLPLTARGAVTGAKPAPISFKADAVNIEQLAAKVIGSLVMVSLLGIAAIYALKRYLPPGVRLDTSKGRRLLLVETIRLSPKTAIYLLEFDGSPVLIAQSSEHIVRVTAPVGEYECEQVEQRDEK